MAAPLPPAVRELAVEQHQIVARRQLLESYPPWQVRRWLDREQLTVVHAGVYVLHNGPLTWHQRAWAAVLHGWPSALHGVSALRAADGPGKRRHDDGGPIHVAVDRDRRLAVEPGIRVHRLDRLELGVQWNLGPPRQRYEEASLTVALSASSLIDGIAVLAAGVQRRRTVARKLIANLDSRARVPNRAFWRGVLDDVASGACSVLEQGFLDHVQRAHGLPDFARQVREETASGIVYRDGEHDGLLIELDGRLHHDTTGARDRDMERDLDATVEGRSTVRLSYGQVFDRACSTAVKIGSVLRSRGWAGQIVPCSLMCAAVDAAA